MLCAQARSAALPFRASGRLRVLHVAVLGGLALMVAASAGRAESVREYEARLSRWLALATQARAESRRGDRGWRETLGRLSREAGRHRTVRRADGSTLSVSHPWLVSRLDEALAAGATAERATALDTAVQEIASYREALAGPPPVDRTRLRAVLAEVVPAAAAGPRFRMEWLQDLARRLMEWLDRLSSRLPDRWGEAPRVVFWVAIGLAAAVLAGALGVAIRALVSRSRRSARAGGPTVEVNRRPSPPSAEAMLARARRAAAEASYRDAIRYLYLSLVLKLDLAGVLAYDSSKTNWEYVRSLDLEGLASVGAPTRGELRPLLISLTTIFDRKWYGIEPAGISDYERCEELFGDIVAGVGAT